MNFEIEGKLIEIFDLQQVTDSFKKREFVIEKNENYNGRTFTETIKFQMIQDKCEQLNNLSVGTPVKVFFNIKGRKWEKNGKTSYFNNLEAWKIESTQTHQNDVPPPDIMEADLIESDQTDELPF